MQTKLFRRDFTLVVIGQIISLFGNAILRFALPLYLLRETGSSTLFGVVTACSFAPMVILSMVGGVLADRVNKRDIMVGLDFSTAAIIMLFYFSLGKIPTVPLYRCLDAALWYFRHIPAISTGKRSASGSERETDGRKCGNQSGQYAFRSVGAGYRWRDVHPLGHLSDFAFECGVFTFSAIMEIFIHIPHDARVKSAYFGSLERT